MAESYTSLFPFHRHPLFYYRYNPSITIIIFKTIIQQDSLDLLEIAISWSLIAFGYIYFRSELTSASQ